MGAIMGEYDTHIPSFQHNLICGSLPNRPSSTRAAGSLK